MSRSLRQSLNLAHTWGGVLAGALIFFVFFTGSLVVFEQAVDRWMMPATRADASTHDAGFEGAFQALKAKHELGEGGVFIYPPSPRQPTYAAHFHDASGADRNVFIKRNGSLLADSGSFGASGFFFPLHYSLHLGAFGMATLGYWIVGLAGMIVLAMVVSGVIVHRRLIRDFFSFRLERARGRALLDLHNLTGVMSLPFLAAMAFSGVAIFVYVYMPVNIAANYPDGETFFHDVLPHIDREPAQQPAGRVNLDRIAASAERIWKGGEVMVLGVFHPGDANGYIAAYRDTPREIAYDFEQLDFDAVTGELLHHQKIGPAAMAYQFLTGLHIAVVDSWAVRWLYFLMGVTGCAVIATGFLVWLDKRAAQTGRAGYRTAQGVMSAATLGLTLATAAMLAANRLLPLPLAMRAEAEVVVFFGTWLGCLLHALLQPGRRSARRQLQLLAGSCAALPALNAVTTGDALPMTLWQGPGAVAGVDLSLLVIAAASAWGASLLRVAPAGEARRYRAAAA